LARRRAPGATPQQEDVVGDEFCVAYRGVADFRQWVRVPNNEGAIPHAVSKKAILDRGRDRLLHHHWQLHAIDAGAARRCRQPSCIAPHAHAEGGCFLIMPDDLADRPPVQAPRVVLQSLARLGDEPAPETMEVDARLAAIVDHLIYAQTAPRRHELLGNRLSALDSRPRTGILEFLE
jgi:hypothetical protein